MVDLIVLDVEERFENLNVVVVDCSPEALRLFCRQLGFVSRIGIKTVLLGELAARPATAGTAERIRPGADDGDALRRRAGRWCRS